MNELKLITDLLICILEVYIFYDFHKEVFRYRFDSRKIHILILSCLTLGLFIINQQGNSLVNLCVTPCLLIVSSFLLYNDSCRKQLLHVLIYFIISAGAEFISEAAFSIVFTVQHMDIILDPYNMFFIFFFEKLIALLILRLVKNRSYQVGHMIDPTVYKWSFVLPVTTLLLLIGFAYSKITIGVLNISKIILVLGSFLLLCTNALIFYLFEKASQIMSEASETKMQNMKLSLEHTHYDMIEDINLEHRKYIHDMNHYLGTIRHLISHHQDDEALHIMDQMNQKFINIDEMTYCSHPILNAILCEKETIARQKNIDYEVDITPSIHLEKISDYDLIAILGNLIDNALEGAEMVIKTQTEQKTNTPARYVKICIIDIFESNSTLIQIENPYNYIHKNSNDNFISSKRDKANHGIGLRSVADAVKRNGGILSTETKDGVFISRVKISNIIDESALKYE